MNKNKTKRKHFFFSLLSLASFPVYCTRKSFYLNYQSINLKQRLFADITKLKYLVSFCCSDYDRFIEHICFNRHIRLEKRGDISDYKGLQLRV